MRSLPEGKPDELTWHVDQIPLLIVGITEAALVGGFLYWAFKGGAATKKTPVKTIDTSLGPIAYDDHDALVRASDYEKGQALEAGTMTGGDVTKLDILARPEGGKHALVGGQKSSYRRTTDEPYTPPAAAGPSVYLGAAGNEPIYETNLIPIAGVTSASFVTVNPGLSSSTVKVDLPPAVNFGSWRNVE